MDNIQFICDSCIYIQITALCTEKYKGEHVKLNFVCLLEIEIHMFVWSPVDVVICCQFILKGEFTNFEE